VNPLETDTDRYLRAERIAPRPNTDVALMRGLAHALYTEGLYDKAFLDAYTAGFDRSADYLVGQTDGQPKSPEWAVEITEVPADTLRRLARRMAKSRTALGTPPGKIEIYSEKIASFHHDDVPPHPAWVPPAERLGSPLAARYPLHLLSPHPKDRLHSQLDETPLRRTYEVGAREPIWLHPEDAVARGIASDDIVRVFNDRGQVLAGALVTNRIRPGVVVLPEGGWYDPAEPGTSGTVDKHGLVNVLTLDKGLSKLAQGNIANTVLVQVERYAGELPSVTASAPPGGG
jgi:anaerobic selenocysteine-containing dehydrogenase